MSPRVVQVPGRRFNDSGASAILIPKASVSAATNSMIAVDTNILLYALDRHEPAKQAIARSLLARLQSEPEQSILLWQVLGETAQQLRRWRDVGRLSSADFTDHIAAIRYLFPVALPVAETFDVAQSLASRFSLSHWDSMLLASCTTAGVTRLYTEDMGASRLIDGIELVNPFV